MSDAQRRALERAAATGDPEAAQRARRELCRIGEHTPKDTSRPRAKIFGGELATPCILCGAPVPVSFAICHMRFRLAEWALVAGRNPKRQALNLANEGPDTAHLRFGRGEGYPLAAGSRLTVTYVSQVSLATRPRNATLHVREWDFPVVGDPEASCARSSVLVFVDGERIL